MGLINVPFKRGRNLSMLLHAAGVSPRNCEQVCSFLSQKGYIAGGFARCLLLFNEGMIYKEDVLSYISLSDIDVFFEDKKHAFRIINETRAKYNNKTKTHDLTLLEPHTHLLIQFIELSVGKASDLIQTFDIINAMVAVDNDGFIINDRWFDAEKSKMIDVLPENSKLKTIFRLSKYLDKNEGYGLSPRTHDYVDMLIKHVCHQQFVNNDVYHKHILDIDDNVVDVSLHEFYRLLSDFKLLLNAKNLLEIWLFISSHVGAAYGIDDYESWAKTALLTMHACSKNKQ